MTDITEVCEAINNFFLKDYIGYSDIYKGKYTISGHAFVSPDFSLKPGQYFRIKGSDLNDGVYCNTAESLETLMDEEFTGQIWLMSVPRSFIALCDDIAAWRSQYEAAGSANLSPFQSENVSGVYSYSKASGGSSGGGTGGAVSWLDMFSARLSPYRRISEL